MEGGVVVNLPSPDVTDMLKDGKIDPPLGILERPYKVATYTIVSGYTPTIIQPWVVLLLQPRIQEVLSNYEFMRADIRMRFLLNAPITTYGTFAVTPVFGNTLNTLATRGTTEFEMISYPGTMLADVSTRESLEIVIPYVSLFDNFPLHEFTYYNGVYMSEWGLHSILPDEATPSCTVEVFANFENIILNAPRRVVPPVADGHMHLDPTRRLTASGVLATVATTMGYTFLGDAISYMGETNNITRLPDVVEGVNAEPEPIRLLPWGNMMTNAYNNSAQYMAPAKYNSSPMKDLNGPNHSFNFYDLIKIPAYLDIRDYALNTVTNTVLRPDNCHGYFSDVTKLFRRFRGGFKVMLRFVCTPLTVARFHISFEWADVIAPSNDDDISDRYGYVVSVQGTTTEYFNVPFINDAHWYMSANANQGYPNMIIRCVSTDSASTIASATVPTITLLTFIAAADDFVMQHPQSPFVYTPPFADGHTDLCSAFRSEVFQDVSGHKGRPMDPRDVEDFSQYFNRYSSADSGLYIPTVNFIPDSMINDHQRLLTDPPVGALDWLSWYFALYTSGGRRYKVPVPDTQIDMVLQNTYTLEYIGAASTSIPYEFMDGISRTYPGLQTITEFEVPFISRYGMHPVYQPAQPPGGECSFAVMKLLPSVQIASVTTTPPDSEAIAVAAGHDYQLHILQPPTLLGVQIALEQLPTPPLPATTGSRSKGSRLSSRSQTESNKLLH